jgi:hypothetical protein
MTGMRMGLVLAAAASVAGCCNAGRSQLPKCDAPTVTSLAKKAIEDAPANKSRGLLISNMGIPGETRYDSSKPKRVCRTTITTQAGTQVLFYSVEWQDKAKGVIWVQTMDADDGR